MRKRTAAVFLAPFVLLFAGFFVAPILYALAQSFTVVERSGLLGLRGQSTRFAGLANYGKALSDPGFVESLGRILLYAAIMVPLMVVGSTVLALILEAGMARWPRFFRTSFFLPYGIPGVIASIMWGFLYAPGTSPFTPVLSAFGIETDLLGPGTVFWSVMNIVVWLFVGYNMLVVVAQLQSIPRTLYEAARIDGAGRWGIAWRIQIPLLRPALVLITVFTIIGSLQLFNEPLVLLPVSGGLSTTYTPTLTAYHDAFNGNDMALAAAESIILALVTAVLSFGFLRFVGRGRR
ncbi:sugar ABC transporter permease [Nonomuraea deserti]|jgi:multiple sugar transport system permease protein|uniref:Sugar ABC transporter permease n=1 Tax=Nonomuraea deserti TaxID=1848322 RepID=A0A4R4W9L2_9ACTN|nr:sugar ABC transporter permease [Nonomuraea deserti]TDD11925.1 sugar ABC transporter permease [Nonomuraea deserti]